ncbi:MAG: hypothetical protein KatS3mg131_0701 [Candidatus Tectimicrobiota bacterium]|nr:MAG: hypothetical protein KatS3mg131_0701 [Candidatus Tectomicrobia bacterium]
MKRSAWGVLALAILAGGCVPTAVGVGAGAGVGTYTYVTGELKATYTLTIDQVWPAALEAMEKLRLRVEKQHMDALGGEILAYRADGTPVKVQLKPLGERSTVVGVRVGFFGSRKKSQLIHTAIQEALQG